MRNLKFILGCSVAALCGVLTAILAQNFADGSLPASDGKPTQIVVEGGVSGKWFVISRINTSAPDGKGFDPSQVYMISDFKPIVKKRGDKWLIQFECNICEDLP